MLKLTIQYMISMNYFLKSLKVIWIFIKFTICILLLNIHILPTHVKTHNILYDFRELFLNSPKTTSTWRRFVSAYPAYTPIPNLKKKQKT